MTATTQTVRDIALENPASVRVFEKYGIDYCCGGRMPLAEACANRNLNVDEVIASLENAAGAPLPQAPDWSQASLAALSTHIVETHHAYIRRELPRLYELAAKVVGRHGDTRPELPSIQAKVSELGEELTAHLGKEEVVLFPYIARFEQFVAGAGPQPRNCFGSVSHPIGMMTQEHDLAGELMGQIRRLSGNYEPPAGACPTYRAFYAGLLEFEQDLHQHIHLENNILFPRAIALEASAV